MKIRLVILDLDDVVIKSRSFITASFGYVLTHLGLPQDGLAHPIMRHCTLHQAHEHLGIPIEKTDEAIRLHIEFQESNLHLLELSPTTVTTLQRLRTQFRTAIVSNRHRNSRQLLMHCKLLEYFEIIIGSEDVTNPKPHPEGILYVMDHFEEKPEHTVMVGDSPSDIIAGKAASTWTVGFDTGYCLKRLQEAEPDHIITDLSELIPLLIP